MKIGFANGCFDLLHEGHQQFLISCRRHCDYLIVAVNSDEYCHRVKGSDRPYQPLHTRLMHVRAFSEAVIPFGGREDALIMEIRPDVIFKGSDHSPEQTHFAARVPHWKWKETGEHFWRCPVIHIPRMDGFSTTLEAQRRGLAHESQRDAIPGSLRKP